MSTNTMRSNYKPVSVFDSADKVGVQQFTENDLLFRVCVLLAVQHYSTWLSAPTGAMITRYVTGALTGGYRDRWMRLSPATRLRYGLLDNPNSKQGHDKQTLRVADIMLKSGWQRNWVWDTKKDTNKQKTWLAAQHPTIVEMMSRFYTPDTVADHTATEVADVTDPKTNSIPGPTIAVHHDSMRAANSDVISAPLDGDLAVMTGVKTKPVEPEPQLGMSAFVTKENRAAAYTETKPAVDIGAAYNFREDYETTQRERRKANLRTAIATVIFIVGLISVASYLVSHY